MADYTTAANIGISVRRMGDDDSAFTGTSIADLGLTCVANMVAPSDITYDITSRLTLINETNVSGGTVSNNTKRSVLLYDMTTNPFYKEFSGGDAQATVGATYARPAIPIGVKQAIVTMTNSDYSIAFFRLDNTGNPKGSLSWAAGQASPFTVDLLYDSTIPKEIWMQCNLKKTDDSDVDQDLTITDLGLNIKYVL